MIEFFVHLICAVALSGIVYQLIRFAYFTWLLYKIENRLHFLETESQKLRKRQWDEQQRQE